MISLFEKDVSANPHDRLVHTASQDIDAVLVFADGTFFWGKGLSNPGLVTGEICFNVSMTGYQEIMTDPSYHSQLICFTFPHVGIVGTNDNDCESKKIHCNGVIVRENINDLNSQEINHRAEQNLVDWLKKHGVVGICDVDTRAITRYIRENGAQAAVILHAEIGELIDVTKLRDQVRESDSLEGQDLAAQVSSSQVLSSKKNNYFSLKTKSSADEQNEEHHIAVIDYGVKSSILTNLEAAGFSLTVLPAKSRIEDLLSLDVAGVFLSNGPGDPLATAEYAVPLIRQILETNTPMFGICLGHQLISIACGMKTKKMAYGHRGANHPVKNLITGHVEITSQNHGFCVSYDNIPKNVEITHISLFDKSIEGIRLKDKPVFSVQHHPEASPGPHDSRYLFKEFFSLVERHSARKFNSLQNIEKIKCQEEQIFHPF